MLALLRLVVFGFLILSVIFVGISLYSRRVRSRKLAKEWEDEGRQGDKDAYMQEGLVQYERSLRRKLIWLVYIVPLTAIVVIVYVTNFK